MKTPSGKIEFYSQNLAIRAFPGRSGETAWFPTGLKRGPAHDERDLSSARAGKVLRCLAMSNHGRWRVHANLDDVSWFHEAPTGKVRGDGRLSYTNRCG